MRDTFAQSLNSTGAILRFVNCDPQTGAYSNSSVKAQQSCSAAAGFPQGDSYFNNFNNLMSYVSGLSTAGQPQHVCCCNCSTKLDQPDIYGRWCSIGVIVHQEVQIVQLSRWLPC